MKGQVLANCGALGLDPAALSLSSYIEAMAARNDDIGPGEPAEPADRARLSRFHRARMTADGVTGNA